MNEAHKRTELVEECKKRIFYLNSDSRISYFSTNACRSNTFKMIGFENRFEMILLYDK